MSDGTPHVTTAVVRRTERGKYTQRRTLSISSGTSCVFTASLRMTPDRYRCPHIKKSSIQGSEGRSGDTSGTHTAYQEHITGVMAKEIPAAKPCHLKRWCSCKNMEANRSVREGNAPSLALRADSTGREACLPNLAQQSPRNSYFLQRSSDSEGLAEQHGGLRDACKSCLFVHPYLLLPLLPPASAFTNPCWPPTPPKKRRGLHSSIGTHRVVPDKLSGKAGDSHKIRSLGSIPGNHHSRPRSPCVSESCSCRAFTDTVSSNDNFPSAAALVQWTNQPCKTCTETRGHQMSLVDEVGEIAHRGSGTGEGEKSEGFRWRKRPHCHEAEKKRCLIEGGSLFQCACCSPWLPLRAPQPMTERSRCGDKDAGCATVFMDWIHQTEPRCDNRLQGLHGTRHIESTSDLGQRADAVPKLAEGGARKQLVNKGRRTPLLIPGRQATCNFADGANAVVTTNSPSQFVPTRSGDLHTSVATELYVASEKASRMIDWEVMPKGSPRGDNVANTSVSVEGNTHVLFAESTPHEIIQQVDNACVAGPSVCTTRPLHEEDASFDYSVFSIATHRTTRETPGIKGAMPRTAAPPAEDLLAEARPRLQRPLLGGRSPRLVSALCHNTSSSVGRRHVLPAWPARHDRSLNKSSGFSSSVLLPSIGCGLAVAQSSLGRGSGLGLYAVRPFSARSRISEYSGLCVDRKVAMLLRSMGTSTHVMRVGMQHQYLVGYRLPFLYGAAGAFINDGRWYADGRRGPGIGARFHLVYDKKRARDRVYVVATRDIKAGEEIFTSYDNLYWALME